MRQDSKLWSIVINDLGKNYLEASLNFMFFINSDLPNFKS